MLLGLGAIVLHIFRKLLKIEQKRLHLQDSESAEISRGAKKDGIKTIPNIFLFSSKTKLWYQNITFFLETYKEKFLHASKQIGPTSFFYFSILTQGIFQTFNINSKRGKNKFGKN